MVQVSLTDRQEDFWAGATIRFLRLHLVYINSRIYGNSMGWEL